MRDIEDYSKKYSVVGFEEYKVLYRRKKILEIIEAYHPKNILEIGCGKEPLFLYVENTRFTVVEPSKEFYNNAVNLSSNKDNIRCICNFFEEAAESLWDDYDMIICASLCHEVEQPDKLLQAIAQVCNEDTVVHICVPNANSMHRLLGKEMEILADIHDLSKNNKDFQQNNVFDANSLSDIVISNGFEIIESGSFFIKPFSHTQMYEMIQKEIINEEILDGLNALAKYMPEFGSEIYVNCKLKMGTHS